MTARRPDRLGLAIIAFGCAAALLIPFFALPPFSSGVWIQSEPVTAALHAVAGLVSLGLALALVGGLRAAHAAVRHPFVLLPGALAVWSLAMTPAIEVPLLSWFGTPEQGEGIAWYFDLAVLTAGALTLQRYTSLRRGLAWTALAAVTGLAGLVAASRLMGMPAQWPWAPFWFYDYLAFYGLYLAVILFSGLRPRGIAWHCAVIGFAIAVVLLSGNRAAVAAAFIVAPASWVLLWLLKRRVREARLVIAAMVLILPVAITPVIVYIGSHTSIRSVRSRMMHLEVADRAVAAQPRLLLTGDGWGHHGDRAINYLPTDVIDFLGYRGGQADWDAVRRQVHFHSHHLLAEAGLSAGLVGLVLAAAILVAIPLYCRARDLRTAGPVAAALATLFSFWFQLPGSVPFMALAMASIAKPARTRRLGNRSARVIAAIIALLAIAQLATAAIGVRVGATMYRAALDNRRTASLAAAPLDDCTDFLVDYGRGGIHLSALFRSFAADLRDKIESEKPILDQDVARLQNYICAAERYAGGGQSLRLATVGLIVRATSLFCPPIPRSSRSRCAISTIGGNGCGRFFRAHPNGTISRRPICRGSS